MMINQQSMNVSDELLYEFVMDEMEQESELIKGLWAKALAHSEGNDSKAKSLYMQYRVQAIKDQLSALEINLDDLSKDELFESIKSGFTIIPQKIQVIKEQKAEAKEQAIKIAHEEAAKQEAEEYGKFGGWLLIFAIFLVLGNLYGFLGVEKYFENESLNILKLLYQNGMERQATFFNTIVYMGFVSYGLLLAFTISFFRKHRDTKNIAILYFGYGIIAVPIIFFLQMKINPDTTNVMFLLAGTVFKVLFYLIMLRYFMVSERVKKTFVNGNDENNNSIVITLLISLGAIVLASVLYGRDANQNTLISEQNMTSAVQTTSESVNAATPSSEPYVDPAAPAEGLYVPTDQNQKNTDSPKNTSDDVWIDTSTGLMWQDSNHEIKKDWQGAIDYCKDLTYAEHTDWQLPSIDNLTAIYVKEKNFKYWWPADSNFWSSSISDFDTKFALLMKNGDARANDKTYEYRVLCVRKNK